MKKTLIGLLLAGSALGAHAENQVLDLFKASFETAVPEQYEWIETDEWYEGLTSYAFLYTSGIKAELRTCVTSDGNVLLSGTTTGGYKESADLKHLPNLETVMESFYEELDQALIADPAKDGCQPKEIS